MEPANRPGREMEGRVSDTTTTMRAVLVTTEFRGVFFGYASDTSGDTISLTGARNCIYWPSENGGFLGLASKGPVKGAGNPHLVVEVFDPIVKMFAAGSNGNAPLDMRVICILPNDKIGAYYMEHADFEPYTGHSA